MSDILCDTCHSTLLPPYVGWTDGAGYIIVTCPYCGTETPTIQES